MELEEITTKRIAENIKKHFGEKAQDVIENLEIEKLIQVPGLGRKTAMAILKKAYEQKTGERFSEILSENAIERMERIISLFSEFPRTRIGKNRFLIYSPTNKRELIEKGLRNCDKALKIYDKIGEESLEELLRLLSKFKGLSPLRKRYFYDRVIVVEEERHSKLCENEFCDTLVLHDPSEIPSLRQYPLVFYVYSKSSRFYDGILKYSDYEIKLEDFRIEDVVPELEVEKFTSNLETIGIMKSIFDLSEPDEILDDLLEKILRFEKELTFPESEKIEEGISEVERELQKIFDEKMEKAKIKIDGVEILKLISKVSDLQTLRDNLPREIEIIYKEMIDYGNRKIEELLGFSMEIFREELSYPIEADPEKIERVEEMLRKKAAKKRYLASKNLKNLPEIWEHLLRREREIYELDFLLAIARIIKRYEMTPPKFIENGLSFKNGRNLYLENPKEVSYKLGETPHDFTSDERITILTGANSGGKTTLLETILDMQILSQMGFYVPSEEFLTTIFDKITYLTKPKAQSAGAFESTLKRLVPLALLKEKQLLLIDELEAITEPGSAAKIIASFLRVLKESENTFCVLVTHLGEEIAKLVDLRCDGIEAEGLDENLELIVKRQPIFGKIGKSTPELIVEKLWRLKKGREKEIYEEMRRGLEG
ncbi:MAG: hypothetical protein ACE5K0_11670 [Candidatus Methanofastidiosia archaeon]